MITVKSLLISLTLFTVPSLAVADWYSVWHQEVDNPKKIYYKGDIKGDEWEDIKKRAESAYPINEKARRKMKMVIKFQGCTRDWI